MNTLEASKVEQFHVHALVEQVYVRVHELHTQDSSVLGFGFLYF